MSSVVALDRQRQPGVTDMTAAVMPYDDRILRLPAVEARVGLSRATIYRRVAAGDFPRPVPLGGKAVGWRLSAILRWVAERGAA